MVILMREKKRQRTKSLTRTTLTTTKTAVTWPDMWRHLESISPWTLTLAAAQTTQMRPAATRGSQGACREQGE